MDISSHIRLWNSAQLRIIDIRRQTLPPDSPRSPWLLPSSAFLYIAGGAASVSMDGMPWPVRPFSVVHGGKGVHLDIRPEDDLHYYIIMYKASLPAADPRHILELMTSDNPFQAQYALQTSDPLYLLDKAQRMHREWQTGSELNQFMARSLFIQFVHEIIGQLGQPHIQVIPPDPVSQSVRYIEEHYREPISLELLGELLSCSPRQLLRKFRAERNVSPIDYLIGTRLRKAKELLAATDAQLKEIAESVGYSDSYYFSRLFKKHMGVSPAHYREQIRASGERPYYPFTASSSSIVPGQPSRYSVNEFDNHYHYGGEEDLAMNFSSKKTLAALAICLSLLASACGNGGASNAPANTSPAPVSGEAAATPAETAADNAAEQTRTVKHAMGEAVVPAKPERVVILTNEGTEALLALGVKPIAAVQSWYQEPWYEHIDAEMQDVTVLGDEFQPNLELIASLQPDLIIGNVARQEEIYEQLNQIAPTVFSDDLVGDWKINFTLYAEALNLQEEGKRLMDEFDRRVAEASAKLGDKLDTQVSIVRFLPTQVRIYQKDTFAGVLLDQLGFARPASQDVDGFIEVVAKETIDMMDGDVMFYFQTDIPGGEDTSKVVEEWLNDPLFHKLQVHQNDAVVKVSEAIWNSAGGYKAANLLLDELVAYFEAN